VVGGNKYEGFGKGLREGEQKEKRQLILFSQGLCQLISRE
jgi:hypothetical protein